MSGRNDSEPALPPFHTSATMGNTRHPTPWCAVVCLVSGFIALVLHVVGVGFHAWFEADVQQHKVSFGLWQAASCVQLGSCTTRVLGFGITGDFEATRVFACATIIAGLIAWFFNLTLIKRPCRVWCIRTCILWFVTVLFGLVTIVLFPMYAEGTAKITVPQVAPTGALLQPHLGWAYWIVVLADVLFFLVLLGCLVFSCHGLQPSEDKRRLLHRVDSGRDTGFGLQGKMVVPKAINNNKHGIETLNRVDGAILGVGTTPVTSARTEPRVQLNAPTVSVQHTGPADTTTTHVIGATSLPRPAQHHISSHPATGGGVRVHVGGASTLPSHGYNTGIPEAYMNTYPSGQTTQPTPSSGSLYSVSHSLPSYAEPSYASVVRPPVAVQRDPDTPTITMLVSNPNTTTNPTLPLTYISTGNGY